MTDNNNEEIDQIEYSLAKLNMPLYNILGNHDFNAPNTRRNITRAARLLNIEPPYYYSVIIGGCRILFLNSNDVSTYGAVRGSKNHCLAEHILGCLKDTGANNAHNWNSAIGEEQLKWIDQQLTEADLLAQSVVIFSHAPFLPEEGMHTLWNGGRVFELLESHSCVKAVICGHNHTGNYICRNGIHHITIKGMVESTANRFAIVSVSDDHLAVKGFGDQPDYDLSI